MIVKITIWCLLFNARSNEVSNTAYCQREQTNYKSSGYVATIFIRRDSRMTSKPNVSSRETVNSRICVSIIKIQRGRK